MIPIDKTDNCKRMLKTGQYQTSIYKDKEDWWLIKYLKDKYNKKGRSEKELKELIKSEWVPIYNTRIDDSEIEDYEDYINRHFEYVYNKAKTVSLSTECYKIQIYKEELNYINSLAAPKWFREFVFIFLGHCKTTNNFVYSYAPIKEYMRYLSLKSWNRDTIYTSVYNRLKKLGLWEEVKITTIIDDGKSEPEESYDIRFKFALPVECSGRPVIVFERQMDLLERMDLITDLYKCDICGTEFVFGNRTQRTVCEKCQKQSLQKRRNAVRDKWRRSDVE